MGQAFDVTQHGHDPLLERQPTERPLKAIAVDDPCALVRDRRVVLAQERDLRPHPDAAPFVIARVHEQSPEPGLEAGRVAEPRQFAPGSDECFLCRVVGPIGVPNDQARQRVHPIDIRVGECSEGIVITGHRADHVGPCVARTVHALAHSHGPGDNSLFAQRLAERGDVVGIDLAETVERFSLKVEPSGPVDLGLWRTWTT